MGGPFGGLPPLDRKGNESYERVNHVPWGYYRTIPLEPSWGWATEDGSASHRVDAPSSQDESHHPKQKEDGQRRQVSWGDGWKRRIMGGGSDKEGPVCLLGFNRPKRRSHSNPTKEKKRKRKRKRKRTVCTQQSTNEKDVRRTHMTHRVTHTSGKRVVGHGGHDKSTSPPVDRSSSKQQVETRWTRNKGTG